MRLRTIRAVTVTAAVLCCALSLSAAAESPLEAAISGKHRTLDFVQRDAARHPLETLTFFGIEPGMTVVEIWPGASGWYTEILAPLLRTHGHLYAAHFNSDSTSQFYRESRADFEVKLTTNPAVYDQVVVTSFNPPAHADIAPPGSADRVVTFRNVHNWYMRGGGDDRVVAAFQAMFRALKPGGVLGVVDHRLPASRPLTDQEDSGYMREDYVIAMAQRAGFVLAAKSEINANPRDTADHPKGVWTLPPTLRLGEVDRDKYLAIGESDRMTLKFVKPKS
ncbi:methyltransferase [Fontimonas sp. SYSU GA230001]|uniref:class I SAM-dependent methyltransferase n=1 Tax=Fontimonas sp. SYSU GA230001 TaxID=3142450 RepID=UPI0032B3AF56